MTSMDRAAIAFSIAITAVGVGIAFSGAALPEAQVSSVPSSPAPSQGYTDEPAGAMMDEPSGAMMDEPAGDAMMDDSMGAMMDEPAGDAMMDDSMGAMMDEPAGDAMMDDAPAGPVTHTVTMPAGTSVAGCEETDECFLPSQITIAAGDTVTWDNADTAAHTVTAGSISEGPTGAFDSGLFLAGSQYSVTLEDPGTYEYFCLVHPWMAGSITVN
ncbi:Blue (Type1) copper domain-containing protein [Nitrosopumilaceae archaeon]|nr:plastocyanin/azurin family copper-binding protein [Nitrosopumilus sp.]MDA7997345.1 plastocyanin/azurin family copper-binding protein [Nitrosopumilus sp.]CAI9832515.1 Blue (Type1) copper domain-containing protein [Nitrosopumilaceae archaeon]